MRLETRKLLDRSFSSLGIIAIGLMGAAILVLLVPIVKKGVTAFVFKGTVEYRKMEYELFDRGNKATLDAEIAETNAVRAKVYDYVGRYLQDETSKHDGAATAIADRLKRLSKRGDGLGRSAKRRLKKYDPAMDFDKKIKLFQDAHYKLGQRLDSTEIKDDLDWIAARLKTLTDTVIDLGPINDFKQKLETLLGPPAETNRDTIVMLRERYGETRMDGVERKLHDLTFVKTFDHSKGDMGTPVFTPRAEQFKGTVMEDAFPFIETKIDAMMKPQWTFYWRFLSDHDEDDHMFGGIVASVVGTLYLTLGAMLFGIPIGVIAAIYLCEYAKPGKLTSIIRVCISTLAGVPSIVFGLFALAFFLNFLHMPKSVLVGSITLALLILPTVIRASEEAILAVPKTYKEAAMGLGAGQWHTVSTVVLPAALPGILTGIIISMGRAAGETAPIIFVAAVSLGKTVGIDGVLSQPTPALPWNIYTLCAEHAQLDEIRHVQYGMALTLLVIVLTLNMGAIILRARISRKLKG